MAPGAALATTGMARLENEMRWAELALAQDRPDEAAGGSGA